MTYKFDDQVIGYPPIESAPLTLATGAFPPITPGFIATAEDRVYGPGEFIYGRANGVIPQFGLCVLTPVWDSTNKTYTINFTACPNTANLGRPVYVAQASGAMAAGQYGWFLDTGITPVNGTASVAADTTVGITAAGQIGANTAGKQLVNARNVSPATQTVVKAGTGASGDTVIYVPDTDGWFVGGYLSGTNVGALAVISSVDPMGKYVVASVANSGVVASNVTVTYNNATVFYNVVAFDRGFAQGAIT